jgi:hypothetical protein
LFCKKDCEDAHGKPDLSCSFYVTYKDKVMPPPRQRADVFTSYYKISASTASTGPSASSIGLALGNKSSRILMLLVMLPLSII